MVVPVPVPVTVGGGARVGLREVGQLGQTGAVDPVRGRQGSWRRWTEKEAGWSEAGGQETRRRRWVERVA